MAERSILKITRNGNSLTLTLPKPIAHRLGWVRGMRVVLEEREGCLVVAELERAFAERVLDRVTDGVPAAPGGGL